MTKRFPAPLCLIFSLIVVAQLCSYLLPRGEYRRSAQERGQEIVYSPCGDERPEYGGLFSLEVEPGSYELCDNDVVSLPWYSALTSIPKGLEAAGGVVFFVLIIGGVVRLVRETGAIDALIQWSADRLKSRPAWLVGGMTAIYALGASTYGMSEELVAFAPLMVAMCIAVRLDAVVAVGILAVGYACGYACAAINPFSVVIAQELAGIVPGSGQMVRWFLLVPFLTVGIHHILRYAARIGTDPAQSLVADVDYSTGFEVQSNMVLTGRLMTIGLIFVSGILTYAFGAYRYDWYTTELSAVFLGVIILVAMVGRISPNSTARIVVEGASSVVGVALIIGFARAVHVVLFEGRVADTVVYGLATLLSDLPVHGAALAMLVFQTVVNFFIPSGSGQASVTMPIMAPLAEELGVTAQTAVLAYQFGDGLTNMVIPTSGILMALLAVGRIPYERWVRFVMPLLLKLYVVAVLAILGAVQFGFGP